MNNPRPSDIVSAAYLKRDTIHEMVGNLTGVDGGDKVATSDDQELNYFVADMQGNEIDGKKCDILYDDETGNTMCKMS